MAQRIARMMRMVISMCWFTALGVARPRLAGRCSWGRRCLPVWPRRIVGMACGCWQPWLGVRIWACAGDGAGVDADGGEAAELAG